MTDKVFRDQRRAWLLTLAAGGVFGIGGLTGLIRRVHAAASRPFPDGVQEIKGDVSINDIPARPGSLVVPGDTVTTGPASYVVFVIGQDAYLLRERSQLRVNGSRASTSASGKITAAAVNTLNLISGKLLSAFARGEKRITTPTATIGIRGTGVYVEVEATRSYVCTCYGETVLAALGSSATEKISATYHDAPRYIYAAGASEIITKAPVINHSDDEIIMLEALLGRSPPFAGTLERRY